MKTLLALMIFLNSCNPKVPKYMHGYIFTKENKPLEGIRIEDPNKKSIFSITNKEGYFKINQLTSGNYLYVLKGIKRIDSLYIVSTHPERGESFYFVEGRKDTLFLK
jgi:hypothetical protein